MKEIIRKRYSEKMGISRMQKRISTKIGRDVSFDEVRFIVDEIKGEGGSYDKYTSRDIERQDGGLKDLVGGVGYNDRYRHVPETGHVIFNVDGTPYPILVTTIDSIIEQYVRQGDNKSGKQIQNEFGLTPRVWSLIKTSFDILKDSIPFSVITLLDINEDDLQSTADDKAKKLVESRMANIYNTSAQRLKDKKFRDFAKAKMGYDVFLEQLDDIVSKYKKREVSNKKIKPKNNNDYMCFITDAHLGKNGTEGIINRFVKLTETLLNKEENNITIVFGGDIGELFVPYGEMHPGQRLGMENITTAELVMLCVDVLEDMLSKLHNAGKKVILKAILGNHDRMTEKKEYDPFRTAGRIIYSFLQRVFKDTDIIIDILGEKHNIFSIGKIKYVVTHGDGFSPAELNRLAIQEVEKNRYLCVISGDKHHLAMKEVSDKVMWIQAPALSGPGRYDKSLAMSSLSGYLGFKVNPDGLLDVGIHRLK